MELCGIGLLKVRLKMSLQVCAVLRHTQGLKVKLALPVNQYHLEDQKVAPLRVR
jgi:hypothetical protein